MSHVVQVLKDYQKWLLTTSIVDGIALTDDLDEILAWDPEPYTCPEGTKQLLCDLVDPALEVFISTVYCGKKFPDDSVSPVACNADPLCGVDDEDGECSASPEVTDKLKQHVLTNFIGAVENPLVREIMVPFVTCRSRPLVDCVDECAWDVAAGECSADAPLLIQSLGKSAKANPKPMCQIVGAVFESGCISASAEKCISNPSCEIDEGEELHAMWHG